MNISFRLPIGVTAAFGPDKVEASGHRSGKQSRKVQFHLPMRLSRYYSKFPAAAALHLRHGYWLTLGWLYRLIMTTDPNGAVRC